MYYNDRLHSFTKVAPYKAIMDASDNELIGKIKKNILKRKLKAKTVSVTHPDGRNVRISNFVKITEKQHVSFDPSSGLKSP